MNNNISIIFVKNETGEEYKAVKETEKGWNCLNPAGKPCNLSNTILEKKYTRKEVVEQPIIKGKTKEVKVTEKTDYTETIKAFNKTLVDHDGHSRALKNGGFWVTIGLKDKQNGFKISLDKTGARIYLKKEKDGTIPAECIKRSSVTTDPTHPYVVSITYENLAHVLPTLLEAIATPAPAPAPVTEEKPAE